MKVTWWGLLYANVFKTFKLITFHYGCISMWEDLLDLEIGLCTERKNHSAPFQSDCLLLYWICPRIPSDQVQLSSQIVIGSAHQGISFFLPSFRPAFDCHPLTNTDHTIQLNPIWQFRFPTFSISLVLKNTSRITSAFPAPRLFASIRVRACACMCLFVVIYVSLLLNVMLGKKPQAIWSPASVTHQLCFLKLFVAKFYDYCMWKK